MNRERKTVHPFRGVARSLTKALRNTVLQFGEKEVSAGARIQWDDAGSYRDQDISLKWHVDDDSPAFLAELKQGCLDSGLPLDSLAIVVTATSRYLGFVDLVFRCALDESDELEPAIDLRAEKPDAAAWKTHVRGCRVDAYLLLARKLEERPLRPWRKGVWLSRASFTVATDYTESLFRPRKLDDIQRKRFQLSAQALRYVHLPEPVWEEYDPDEPPEVYLDAEIMAQIAAKPKSLPSRLAQAELAYVFLRGVLTDAYMNREQWSGRGWRDITNTLLGKVLRAIAGRDAPATECSRWMDRLAADRGLESVVSECEGVTEIRTLLRDAFRE